MKFFKKLLLSVLVLATLLPLVSCGGSSVTIIEYNGEKMSSGVFSYMLSENKSYLLAVYEAYYGITDSAEFWNTAISEGGPTIGDSFKAQVVETAKNMVVTRVLAKEYGITITDEDKAAVQKTVDECIAAYGSKAKWGMYLSKFGIDIDGFVQYMEDQYLMNRVAEYISSENGPYSIDESQLFENYKKEYSYVQHILFNRQFKHKNEEGTSVVMTDEEKAARKAELTELAEKMANGEAKWEDYVSQNEDGGTTYTVTDDNTYAQNFQDAALDMEVGEYRLVETEFGYHLMNRLELTEEIYKKNEQEGKTSYVVNLKNENYMKVINEKISQVVVNEEELKKYTMAAAPVLS